MTIKYRRTKCSAVVFIVFVAASSCSPDLPSHAPEDTIRMDAVAELIIEKTLRFYADEFREGKESTFSIDKKSINEIGNLQIEEAMRRIADSYVSQMNTAERILRFSSPISSSVSKYKEQHILVDVIDINIEYCCHIIGIQMIKNQNEWHFGSIYESGFLDETDEFRKERATRSRLLR